MNESDLKRFAPEQLKAIRNELVNLKKVYRVRIKSC